MPELPEVHGYQQYINKTCLHHTIVEMDVRDDRLIKKPLKEFKEVLLGEQWTSTERIGKYLFIHVSTGKIVVVHFGMTGRPNYYHESIERPRFGHIEITFDNGYKIAFENKRKFGWWDITDSVETYRKEHKLNRDARELTFEQFLDVAAHRKTAIKNVLMDQSVTTGVGNWIADDVLYQARIHPLKKANTLTRTELKTIYDKLQHVIEVAIDLEAQYKKFPEYFLIHNRKGRDYCYHTGDELEKIKVGGRTTYVSPEWQKL
ncbi:Fpg/Nei family DNA glycosylase [Cochleicola gelatinilyticus]|uniref:DNA-formamidopyrimidine glycosylase n=1 Tax=Cochleicola gelatinilyticus TaxID=1763537 RepID=A0A167KFN7_9FLAO|nr:DNA-formamidopyrimidine glycosylase family protein [Cochleicola gelatinilyticus]OAB81843.1 DNA-formamidopyrimidine glycosylase [Cochleicola gelatinilyticus]